jgi:plasmid stabilization system protein ParE
MHTERHFFVEWLQDAENQLAEIWLGTDDRQAVTTAQAEIDRLLEIDPIGSSTELAEGLRKRVAAPLVVFFSVDVQSRRVEVAWVSEIAKKG